MTNVTLKRNRLAWPLVWPLSERVRCSHLLTLLWKQQNKNKFSCTLHHPDRAAALASHPPPPPTPWSNSRPDRLCHCLEVSSNKQEGESKHKEATEREQFDETFKFSRPLFGVCDISAAPLSAAAAPWPAEPSHFKTKHVTSPSVPLSGLFFFVLPDHMTASPFCPWPYEHLFGLFMNICMRWPGEKHMCGEGCRDLWAGRLYWLWQGSPTGASAAHSPWHSATGPVLPPSSMLPPAKANQWSPTPTHAPTPLFPLPSHVSWKMTGRDILPSGHSQLTAINDTTHGVWGEEEIRFLLFLLVFCFF